ncbi:GNAT family N-acetyltransferase [bacterium SPL81]|nr:GNAT family N-acetyltransferase [Acinetobacter baumannii]
MKIPILESSRLNLFIFSIGDISDIYPCITPTLTRYMTWEPAQSLEALEHICKKWLIAEANVTDLHFVLRDKENLRFIGLIGLHRIHTLTPELVLWIREDCHNQGFAKEALLEVFCWASRNISAQYFVYPVAVDNQPSRKLAEFLGGTLAGYKTESKYQAVIYHIPPHPNKIN